VYRWLIDRGLTAEFNKPEIENDLRMPYITVRKAIDKLKALDIVHMEYDTCQKIFRYSINSEKRINSTKNINIVSGSYQYNNTISYK
jgi:hypothetical protein